MMNRRAALGGLFAAGATALGKVPAHFNAPAFARFYRYADGLWRRGYAGKQRPFSLIIPAWILPLDQGAGSWRPGSCWWWHILGAPGLADE